MEPLLDLYTDYLISSFNPVTATGLSRLVDNIISHDTITRFLAEEIKTSADLWKIAKRIVRTHQDPNGYIIIDDTIEQKPYTDESELVTWHFDHAQGKAVKGIQIESALYVTDTITVPVAFQTIRKTETVVDQKTGKAHKKSPVTKNQIFRDLLRICVNNQIPFRYVMNDVWYSSKDNMNFIKNELKKDFIMPVKSNRKIALSISDKRQGLYHRVDSLALEAGKPRRVYLEGVQFPLHLAKQEFINDDGSSGVLYLVSSQDTLGYDQITQFYEKRWNIEVYHKSLKSNLSLEKSPTRTVRTQTNHIFAALCAFIKLETTKMKTSLNHFAIKGECRFFCVN